MAAKTCSACGKPLQENARFCGQCGAVTDPSAPATAPALPAKPASRVAKTIIDEAPAGARVDDAKTLIDTTSPAASPLNKTIADPPRPSTAAAAEGTPALRTMLGFASPLAGPAAPPRPAAPAPSPPLAPPLAPTPAPARAPAPRGAKGTMIGMPVADLLNPAGAQAQAHVQAQGQAQAQAHAQGQAPAQGHAQAPAQAPPPTNAPLRTMLGVAMPGIAPLHPGASAEPPASSLSTTSTGKSGTMLGVAVPGIAPLHAGSDLSPASAQEPRLRKAVEIVPAPPPLVDEPLPAAPVIARKRGVPLGWVAGLVAVLVLAAGVTVALLWKSKPLVAQPRVDEQGKDELHLRCESCPDGTVATLDSARSTFKGLETDLLLAQPLKVGDNNLTVHLDRPNLGRDEAVKLVVPITFRVRADLSDIGSAHPAITVRVEALPGSDVVVDGKPVALDASGTGSYALDITADTEGPADDKKTIDRTISYAVTPKAGTAQKGTVTAKVDVVPLHLDAPGLHPVIETGTFHLAGRTLKGGSVTANGHALHMDPDGAFAQPFDAAAPGDLPVELRATAGALAPRTAHLVVKRVEHLADEAKAREQAPALGYDAIAADLSGSVGQATVVEGDVVEARTAQSQTLAVIDDVRGCAHAPCLVRVVYGGDTSIKHGQVVRAYGRVTRAVTAASGSVPEVEADFVLLGRGKK